MAPEFAGRVVFASSNVSNAPETAAHFGVMGLPTVVALKAGGVLQKVTGGKNRRDIEKLIALCES